MKQQSDPTEPNASPIERALLLLVRLASVPLILLGIALWASVFVTASLIRPVATLVLPTRPRRARRRESWASRVGTRNA